MSVASVNVTLSQTDSHSQALHSGASHLQLHAVQRSNMQDMIPFVKSIVFNTYLTMPGRH